ncbi:MAG: ABC transporter ATP-binding protein [Chloroflexota bacterium]|nr:ABC transporter ATP-binding protein [Chloroflexota bacterium]
MPSVVACRHLTKTYGDIVAVNDVSLDIEQGEIFGLVGPNGAGKTTLVEMIEGLRTPDRGAIRVLGLDPAEQRAEIKQRIGVLLQATSIQPDISVKESLELFRRFYRHRVPTRSLLKLLTLEEHANSRFKKLSGGLQQRTAIALALVSNPAVLFLDEPTTGLDPQARRNTWDLLERIRQRGKTILLTTHYMEEAEKLCDRVGIIDYGKIIALDTPRGLVNSLGAETKIVFSAEGVDAQALQSISAVTRVVSGQDGLALYTSDQNNTLQELVRAADAHGFVITNLRTESANLDDVFLTLTGREIRE